MSIKVSNMGQRLLMVSIAATAIVTVACHEGPLSAPAGPEASVAMTASLSLSSGGTRQAFDKVDRMVIRFSVGSDVRLEKTVAFNPATAQTALRISVPLRASSEAIKAEIELHGGTVALFKGSATPTLSTSTPTPVTLTLNPIVAGVSCGSLPLQLSTYGVAGTLAGAATFATGDTVTSAPVSWSATGQVVNLATDGQLIALQDGSAVATCSAGGFSATRTIQVAAVPRFIQVDPASATIPGGSSVAFTAQLFDAVGNPITSAQPVVWTSTNTAVAAVSATGVVSAGTAGTARIGAASGTVSGNSNVTSIAAPAQGATSEVTVAATGITGTTATLVGSVSPTPPNSATATEAWFAWGTTPTPATQSATPHQTLAAGAANVLVSAALSGLTPGAQYFYQVVTQNGGTTSTGAVQSFRTPALPSAVTIGQDPTYTRGYAVQGTANSNGSAAVAWFDYGTSATLATSAQTVKQPIGGGTNAVTLRHGLPGLQPSTTYYVRLSSSNLGGTTLGNIVSFTTSAAAP